MPMPIHQLSIGRAFDGLTAREKWYAHHMAKAAWYGTRIILCQVSPESNKIFDVIMSVHQAYQESFQGSWEGLADASGISHADVQAFLDYAASFLSNIGTYYGSGDQKFVPSMEKESFGAIVKQSDRATAVFAEISDSIFSPLPSSLGYPSKNAQSAYYPGLLSITPQEIADVSRVIEDNEILPENTRVRKVYEMGRSVYEVLQAAVETTGEAQNLDIKQTNASIRVIKGDHHEELKSICNCLQEAVEHCANTHQQRFLRQYIQSFKSGDLHICKESQETWIKDSAPAVENIFGFVEPYRDPFGIRAEFEGLVAISDREETKLLSRLVEESSKYIKRLPWTEGCSENDEKGPFEKTLFEPPDFTSIHALAYCSSIIFPGINLPNYNDIRQECGFKNVIIANRMSAESNEAEISAFVDPSEALVFQKHKYAAYYLWVVLHELLGHGTGKMMTEESGTFNFDIENPPIDPVTKAPISSWYRPGQTWTGVFADLATTVDECRAELVGAYLMDDTDLLSLFGFNSTSTITAQELTYNMYVQLGVDGLRGLQNYNVEDSKWGQAHSRAHFAMLKCLLSDGSGFMRIDCDSAENRLTVFVDRSRIITDGKPALGRMLLKLHMYRCTADVGNCRAYYEELSRVEGQYLEWRRIVLAKKQPKWVFVQANTFIEDGQVILREYDATPEGVIQSWAERTV